MDDNTALAPRQEQPAERVTPPIRRRLTSAPQVPHNSHITEIAPMTTPKLIGYARVSTVGQDHTSQIENLEASGCSKIFI